MFKTNLHTHTYRCKHAEGDAADYCRMASGIGLDVLGISDHTPLPDGRWESIRMAMDELDGYCAAIDDARRDFPDLVVLKGMECEFAPEYAAFYRDELIARRDFDYLIGGVHFFPFHGEWRGVYQGTDSPAAVRAYTDFFIESMASGLFAFMAHPDLFANAWLEWDREAVACSRAILEAAQDTGVPLEINAYGLVKPEVDTPAGKRPMYPLDAFWELAAEYRVSVIVNCDAHWFRHFPGRTEDAYALRQRYDLRPADLEPLISKPC
jgi:histidinol-phosphatase (PHP family)